MLLAYSPRGAAVLGQLVPPVLLAAACLIVFGLLVTAFRAGAGAVVITEYGDHIEYAFSAGEQMQEFAALNGAELAPPRVHFPPDRCGE